MIGIIHYGAGNLQSLTNALLHIGAEVKMIESSDQLDGVSHLVLPGVGAFGFCAARLRSSGLLPSISEWTLVKHRPILGICVGMQLLADSSTELGSQVGLGWVGGTVDKLVARDRLTRIPHVGWNSVRFEIEFGEFRPGAESDFYFDHSYALKTPIRGQTLGKCEHGEVFCAAVKFNNIIGAQFHPEKSQTAGLRFLRSFISVS